MQDDRYPFAPPPLPGDTAKPHRRHRPRVRGGARPAQDQARTGAVQPAPETGKERAQPAARPQPQNAAPRQEGGSRRQRRRGGAAAPAAAPAAMAQQAPQRQNADKAPARTAQQQKPPRAATAPRPAQQQRAENAPRDRSRRAAAPAQAEDPGLLLITRRPPKQKFANFEEYIAAHGGVTVPVEEET